MSQFDTTTNTGSTTFTNSWGTVQLLPSDTVQKASGFDRTEGWRYFEAVVDNQGGDNSRLFIGLAMQPNSGVFDPNWLFGGASKQGNIIGNTFIPAAPYNVSAYSLTACTGDVFMFAVDMSGGGRNHSGSVILTSISNGSGQMLIPLTAEVGKNGVWPGAKYLGFAWPSFGYPMRAVPWVARDSTTASTAIVSLRVETTSFAYAIPTGMVAWGDGPEGGALAESDADVYWDPAKHHANFSLSGNNRFAVVNVTYSFNAALLTRICYSTVLPTTGKRVIEVVTYRRPGAVNGSTFKGIGLADGDATITASGPTSTQMIGKTDGSGATDFYKRGSNASLSVSVATQGYDFYYEDPGQIAYIDFDTSRFWLTGGIITSPNIWWGDKSAALADPYLGNAGFTFTASVPGMRLYIDERKNNTASANSYYLNAGQTPFTTFPLLPGWLSMDGSREAFGVGAKWDTTTTLPGSTTFYADDLIYRGDSVACIQGTTVKNSGRYYFELFNSGNQPDFYFGLRRADAATISATNGTLVLDQGLFFRAAGSTARSKIRYNAATLSWTCSNSRSSGGDCQNWYHIAIDFDLGYIWAGVWNKNDRHINWTAGADPETNTQPDMTFTASTTMRIATINQQPGGTFPLVALVAEDGNVIGSHTGFSTWNGTLLGSITATPSGWTPTTTGSGVRVLWPYGVAT